MDAAAVPQRESEPVLDDVEIERAADRSFAEARQTAEWMTGHGCVSKGRSRLRPAALS
jgi:hypothetical protein